MAAFERDRQNREIQKFSARRRQLVPRTRKDRLPFCLLFGLIERAENGILFAQNSLDRRGRVNSQRLKFAKMKNANDLVNIRARQDNSSDRGITWRSFGLELGIGKNLHAEVGRCINQAP